MNVEVGTGKVAASCTEERWGKVLKGLPLELHVVGDPAERPLITAEAPRDQIDLVARLNQDDPNFQDEPDFFDFVWMEKGAGNTDDAIPETETRPTSKCEGLLLQNPGGAWVSLEISRISAEGQEMPYTTWETPPRGSESPAGALAATLAGAFSWRSMTTIRASS